MRALEQAMEPSLVTNVDVLEELFSSLDVPAEPASKKMRRGGWHPVPRRGDSFIESARAEDAHSSQILFSKTVKASSPRIPKTPTRPPAPRPGVKTIEGLRSQLRNHVGGPLSAGLIQRLAGSPF